MKPHGEGSLSVRWFQRSRGCSSVPTCYISGLLRGCVLPLSVLHVFEFTGYYRVLCAFWVCLRWSEDHPCNVRTTGCKDGSDQSVLCTEQCNAPKERCCCQEVWHPDHCSVWTQAIRHQRVKIEQAVTSRRRGLQLCGKPLK